jgi:hypothetical protein
MDSILFCFTAEIAESAEKNNYLAGFRLRSSSYAPTSRQINQKPIKNYLSSPPWRIFTLRSLRALRLNQFFFVHRGDRGLRPLRAVGSKLYEPEAIGPRAYAPVGGR